MKKIRGVIGCTPGLRQLERAMDDAKTPREAAELWFASPLIPDNVKQRVTQALEYQALQMSPLRRMPAKAEGMRWGGIVSRFNGR